MAAMAFASGDIVSIYIDNAPTTKCEDIPDWFNADVRYFGVNK